MQSAAMDITKQLEQAARLVKAREARGFRFATDAAKYHGWKYQSYAQHEQGIRGITRAASRYAKAFRVSEAWLLTGEGVGPRERSGGVEMRAVQVIGHVQAGYWTEAFEWEEEDRYLVPVPADPELAAYTLRGAELRGNSMNKWRPEGTVVVVTDQIETAEDLRIGSRYLVERTNSAGEHETTVKTLWKDDQGEIWLLPESTDPRFQEPIKIDGNEGDTIRIMGRVTYSVAKEG